MRPFGTVHADLYQGDRKCTDMEVNFSGWAWPTAARRHQETSTALKGDVCHQYGFQQPEKVPALLTLRSPSPFPVLSIDALICWYPWTCYLLLASGVPSLPCHSKQLEKVSRSGQRVWNSFGSRILH
ncbi:hypothetical protein CapIbe_010103 [Capra ibex]